MSIECPCNNRPRIERTCAYTKRIMQVCFISKAPHNAKGGRIRSGCAPLLLRGDSRAAARPAGRRRPALPQGRPCSTIGAGGLNFRVRYGTGCAPAALAAGPRGAHAPRPRSSALPAPPRGPRGPHSASVPTPRDGSARPGPTWAGRARPISGARLSGSPRLHLRPINQVVSLGPYRREGSS